MVICPECGKEFKRINRKYKTCSHECTKARRIKLLKESDERRSNRNRKGTGIKSDKEVDTSNAINIDKLRKDFEVGEPVKVMHEKELRKCKVVTCYPHCVKVKLKNYDMCFGYDEVMR